MVREGLLATSSDSAKGGLKKKRKTYKKAQTKYTGRERQNLPHISTGTQGFAATEGSDSSLPAFCLGSLSLPPH